MRVVPALEPFEHGHLGLGPGLEAPPVQPIVPRQFRPTLHHSLAA